MNERLNNVIADALLDASFEECEKALSAIKPSEREMMISRIFKRYHQRCAKTHTHRIKRTKKGGFEIIAPLVRMGLSQKCGEAIVRYRGTEKKYNCFSDALALAQTIREIHGKSINTIGIGSGYDFYTVRSLVPIWGRKRRVNICISATSVAEYANSSSYIGNTTQN